MIIEFYVLLIVIRKDSYKGEFMSNTKHLADLMKVCSILPALAIMPAMAVDVTEVTTLSSSHSVQNSNNEISGLLDGGLYYVRPGGKLEVFETTFANNVLDTGGNVDWGYGLIFNKGEMTVSGAEFVNNTATVGGAIASSLSSTKGEISQTVFKNNHAWLDGGAIASYGPLKITNSEFDGNTAQYTYNDETKAWSDISAGDDTAIGGGAIAFGAVSDSSIASVSDTIFKNNKSGVHGGAIATRLARDADNSAAKLDVAATFVNNFAEQNGGAIYNTFYADNGLDKGDGVTVAGVFEGNKAGNYGGAIYNDGTIDKVGNKGGVMTINGSEFDNNSAAQGGAIYNQGTLTINGGEFEDNYITGGNGDGGAIWSNGTLKIINTDFSENWTTENAEGDYGYGGAIFARGDLVDIRGNEKEYAKFEENHALTGGAVYISKHALSTNIENVEFKGNWASDIGALGIFGKNVTLTNLHFIKNYTTGKFENFNDGGGALFFGAEAQAVLDKGLFVGNESAGVGGAIATRSPNKGNNSDAKLDIKNSTFRENKATTQGGAIYSAFYNSQEAVDHVYVTDSVFVANEASEGGAIYNEGLADRGQNFATIKLNNVTFKNNIASKQGGAIYNGIGGTVVLTGKNVFEDNFVGTKKVTNDIYNMGALNIDSGTTTINGGVRGNGTLTLAEGATLNIGTSAIIQDAFNINGIVQAAIVNKDSFGRLQGKVVVGENAKLELSVGAVGTYDIFGGQFVNVTVGDAYIATATEDGIVIETKAVEDLAKDIGLTTQAAGMVAGLANSSDKAVQKISLMAQQAINDGDIAFVERETAKMNPESKPVAQSVSASVQNQVMSLTAGRMSNIGGANVGRAGGDKSQESGFWMQGLFNKSKYADQFHGYTRGFALGGDTVIDRVFTLGGGFAYSNTDVHADLGRDTTIESNTLFAYAQYKPNKWYANTTLTYSMADYSESASVFGVKSLNTYSVDTYGAQVMTGYDFASGVSTEAGVRYMHVMQDAYTNMFGGQVQEMNTDFLSGVAGLKYAFEIKSNSALKLRPELHAAMTYDFVSDESMATVIMSDNVSYQVGGERLSRIGVEFGIGLTAHYKGINLSVMYDLDLHENYTSQTGMIKFRGQF